MPFIIKPVILFITAVTLLRITGRRSIAQMTIAQTVLIISIGAIIVEPFADKDIIKTIIAAAVYVAMLLIFQFFELHFKVFKKLAVGQEIDIIMNGMIIKKNIDKVRMTETEVMSRIRQAGIPSIEHIEKGTLEPNGEFGYRLKKEHRPIKIKDIEYILNEIVYKDYPEKHVDNLSQLIRDFYNQ